MTLALYSAFTPWPWPKYFPSGPPTQFHSTISEKILLNVRLKKTYRITFCVLSTMPNLNKLTRIRISQYDFSEITPVTQDSFQNIKKRSMAGIQVLNNLSFESDCLKSKTMWASFYDWESFRYMVLHKVRKRLPRIQKSWETSRCWAPLNREKWAETRKIMC